MKDGIAALNSLAKRHAWFFAVREAYRVDIETRTNPNGNQRDYPEGHHVNAHEITAGAL